VGVGNGWWVFGLAKTNVSRNNLPKKLPKKHWMKPPFYKYVTDKRSADAALAVEERGKMKAEVEAACEHASRITDERFAEIKEHIAIQKEQLTINHRI
jgi:hypothetical protein